MLFLRSWLEEYIKLSDYNDSELVNIITRKSSEVEEVLTLSDYFQGKVVVGRIDKVENHPNADKLKVLNIDVGQSEKIQIISAAPNSREGLLVPVALVGAKLAGGVILERKMRGLESFGMCCGKSELMLETEHSSGLWELNQELDEKLKNEVIGQSICQVFPELFPTESVFDIKILPDKISSIGHHLGLAKEIAFSLEKPELLRENAKNLLNPDYIANQAAQILEKLGSSEPTHTPSFKDTTGMTNSFWLFSLDLSKEYKLPHTYKKRMFLLQKNLVDSSADLSNYLLSDIGQPTHFFDGQKIESANHEIKWTIKTTQEPVHFAGLGQLKEVELPAGLAVLTDANNQVIHIPGISGGEKSKTETNSSKILIEIANFKAEEIARNSFKLNYRSEGAKIWAGGVQLGLSPLTLIRISQELQNYGQLKLLLAKTPTEEMIRDPKDLNSKLLTEYLQPKTIQTDLNKLASRLDNQGTEFWQPIIVSKLSQIGKLEVQNNLATLELNPVYNHIHLPEDLLAELVRLIGYDKLQPEHIFTSTSYKTSSKFLNYLKLREKVAELGLQEVISRPFTSENYLIKQEENLKVLNPYKSTEPFLRDTLFPSLMQVLASNFKKGDKSPKVFELNKVYTIQDKTSEINEKLFLSCALASEDPYLATTLIYRIKSILKAELKKLSEHKFNWGQGYIYNLQLPNADEVVVELMEIKNSSKKDFDLPLNKKIWFVNFSLPDDFANVAIDTHDEYTSVSDYPLIKRTYSLVADRKISWKDIQNSALSIGFNGQTQITPIERFSIENEQDVINFNVIFMSYERTLESSEVEQWEHDLINHLNQFGNVSWRS